MHKPKDWEGPEDDILRAEVVSFAVSLSTASCGDRFEHLYAEKKFERALYRFHVYYTDGVCGD